MRIVVDTGVFVRSLIRPYGACGEIAFAHASQYRLFLSRPILTEYLEVLARPELTRKFKALLERSPRRLLDILSQAEVVEPVPIASGSRAPSDDKFLATAVACNAQYLVSEDLDLLELRRFQGIEIVTCTQFLELLRAQPAG